MKRYLSLTSFTLLFFCAVSSLAVPAMAASRCTDLFEKSTPESMAVRLTEIQNVETQIFKLQEQINAPPVGWLGQLLRENNLASREAVLKKLNDQYKELVLRLADFATYPINIDWVKGHLNYHLHFNVGARQAFVWMMEQRTEATTREQHEFLNSVLLYLTYSTKFNPAIRYSFTEAIKDSKTEDFPLWVDAVYSAYKDQPQVIAQYARELKISVMMYNYDYISTEPYIGKTRDQVTWERTSEGNVNVSLADFTPIEFTGDIRGVINSTGNYYYPDSGLFYIESPYGRIIWSSAHTNDDLNFRPHWLRYYR